MIRSLGAVGGVGLLDHPADRHDAVGVDRRQRLDHAVGTDVLLRHALEGDDASAGADADTVHVGEQRRVAHQFVGQQHGERLVPDRFAGTPDGVAEPAGLILVDDRRPPVGADAADPFGQLVTALGLQCLDHVRAVLEVGLDTGLGAVGHDHDVVDPGPERLIDDDLQQRRVTDREQLFGNRLGGREETGSQPGRGDDGALNTHFADPIDGTRRYSRDSDADLRVQVRQNRRDHRGPAVVRRRPADHSGASRLGSPNGGQEGVHAGRCHVPAATASTRPTAVPSRRSRRSQPPKSDGGGESTGTSSTESSAVVGVVGVVHCREFSVEEARRQGRGDPLTANRRPDGRVDHTDSP